MADTLRDALCDKALEEGFADIGFCRPDATPDTAGRLAQFVGKGYHGQMSWMAERMTWRGSATALWPDAKTVVMLAEPYTPPHDPLKILDKPDSGAVSVYAQNEDYHDIVKKRLKRVGRWLIEQAPNSEIKVFVDTAPVMEKPLAEAAGLGWQGKHTNLVSRNLGSWFFLGAIFTTLELTPEAKSEDHCGGCTRCLDICPTKAFPAPYQLDARRCISYLTIEHDGPVDEDLRPLLGNRIYGCDDCLAVCPWNKFAIEASELRYKTRESLRDPALEDLAKLSDQEFRTLFRKSPVKRIGRDRFVRNVLYAIGNSGKPALAKSARGLTKDTNPMVRDAADWALARLGA